MQKDEKALEAVESFKEFMKKEDYEDFMMLYCYREEGQIFFGASGGDMHRRIGFAEDIKNYMLNQ